MKLHPIESGFRSATKPPDRRTPWQWCEEHVTVDNTSPFPGRWRSDNSPWVKAPMEAAADSAVRRIVIRCAAQTAKTQTCLCLMCWVVDQEPGPALYVMAAKDEARDFMRDRVLPTFRKCRPVSRKLATHEGLTFVFSTMPFYFTGSHSKSKLQSKPIRWLFLDEIRNYPDGALELALKRTRSYWNAKELLISTANMVGDSVDAEYMSGSREVYNTRCPACNALEPLVWERVEWDKEEEAKPQKEFSIDRLTRSIRLKCRPCGHRWRDVPHERRQIACGGEFVSENPLAARNKRSFHWNALLPPQVTWASIVEEYLSAMRAARANPPDLYPLKRWYNETMGLSWEQALGVIDDFSFLDQRKADYDFNDPWPEEIHRFMAADKQAEGGEHYWWLVRAFGPNGRSRLIAYGRADSTAELEDLRVRYNVPLANAMIDSGFRASEVYRWCQRSQWKAFKGDKAEMYAHDVEDPVTRRRKTVYRIWKKPENVDPAFGTHAKRRHKARPVKLHLFSSATTKDFLAEFMTGTVGEWTLPRAVGSEYMAMVTAERRAEKVDSRGRVSYQWVQTRKANHLLDCELMCLVAAVITKIVQEGTVRAPKALHGNEPKAQGNAVIQDETVKSEPLQVDGAAPAIVPGVRPGGVHSGESQEHDAQVHP